MRAQRTNLLYGMKVVVLMLLLAGCGKKASDEIDFGTVENSVYHNNYFGLNVPLPKEWSVQDQTEQRRLMKLGGKIISGNDKSMEAVLKASELQSVNLFGVFEHPPDSPVTFNPSILAIAEDVRHLPGIKTGKDYHFQSRKVLESGQLDISFPKEIYTQQIGGVGFDVMEAEMHVRTMIVKQKYYSAIMKGYALSVVVSFVTDEQDAALLKILEGVTFNQSAAP